MFTITRERKNLALPIALGILAFAVFAIPQRAAADDFDPPARVARLNFLRGSVSFQPGGETDWAPAVLNRPMTTGDRLWTDDGARAEMHIGSATIRLDTNTGFSFLNLDDRTVQMQLAEGTLNIRVNRVDPDEIFEVDAPNLAFSILQPGQYRIQAASDGNSTVVTVRSGRGEATGGGRIYTVNSGLVGNFTGTDTLDADIYAAGGSDEFDNWSRDRDRREDSSRSAQYVSRDVVGYEDLDDNGSWRGDPDYGEVWVPRVSADWAPYRDGHWAWISPWGWTWVDDAPWGYAPFHYGRWVNARGNWCWVPGPIAVRPVYAPALVAFIGGPGFGLSVSFGGGGGGNVGWFPLGPREVYVPGYHTSREYVNRVNVSNTTVNVTTITNVYNVQGPNNNRGKFGGRSEIRYANRNVPGGVTAVPQNAFASAQPVSRSAIRIDQRQLSSAPVNTTAAVAPTRNSVMGNSAPNGRRIAQPPAAIANRTVVAKTPPPPPPVPFARQQQSLATHPGQPLATNEVQSLRPANGPAAQPLVRQAPPGRPANANMNPPGRQPSNGGPSNMPPNPAANAPVNNAPPARNDRQDRSSRGQFGNGQPSNAPVNNAPPAQSNQPDRSNRGQFGNAQPPNAPVNNTPPVQNGQQDRFNRGQFGNAEPSNAPVNNVPPSQNNQQDRSNRGQPNNVQPSNVPPPNPAVNAPVNSAPPAQNNQRDQSNRGQFGNGRPSNPPSSQPANAPVNNPPVNNTPPGQNNQRDQSNRGQQPNNVRPSNAPPPPPAAPPVNNPPPARNDRGPDRPNQGQPPNQQPPKVSEAPKQPNPPAAQPAKETPQDAKDKEARDKQKKKDQ